jgi:hypothetical protein
VGKRHHCSGWTADSRAATSQQMGGGIQIARQQRSQYTVNSGWRCGESMGKNAHLVPAGGRKGGGSWAATAAGWKAGPCAAGGWKGGGACSCWTAVWGSWKATGGLVGRSCHLGRGLGSAQSRGDVGQRGDEQLISRGPGLSGLGVAGFRCSPR